MITAIVVVLVLLLAGAVVVAIAYDTGPGPAETVLAYETAWDRLDFEALWRLSGLELRDGLGRREYVEAKRAAYANVPPLERLVKHVAVETITQEGDRATALSRLELADGGVIQNDVELARRDSAWRVVSYSLRAPA